MLDANDLRVRVSSADYIANDQDLGRPGLEYPPGSGRHPVYAAGLWLSAWMDVELRMAVTDYRDDFAAGGIAGGGPEDTNLAANHVYSFYRSHASTPARDSALAEYQREAVPRGAPPASVLPNGELSIPSDQQATYLLLDEVSVDVPQNPENPSFALGGIRPNPSPGSWIVEFTLPSTGWAMLELLDIQGRQLQARDVGHLGPGWHRVELAPRSRPAAGLYLSARAASTAPGWSSRRARSVTQMASRVG